MSVIDELIRNDCDDKQNEGNEESHILNDDANPLASNVNEAHTIVCNTAATAEFLERPIDFSTLRSPSPCYNDLCAFCPLPFNLTEDSSKH